MLPDSGNKRVNVIRRDSKSGTMRLDLKDIEEEDK